MRYFSVMFFLVLLFGCKESSDFTSNQYQMSIAPSGKIYLLNQTTGEIAEIKSWGKDPFSPKHVTNKDITHGLKTASNQYQMSIAPSGKIYLLNQITGVIEEISESPTDTDQKK